MANSARVTDKELAEHNQRRKKDDKYQLQIDHLNDRMDISNTNLRKIYSIWDGFFKVVGTLLSVLIVFWILLGTRSLYYTNGKWLFGWVVICGLAVIVLLFVLIWLVWQIVNALLLNKINSLDC